MNTFESMVIRAARTLKAIGRTPNNKAGLVTSDQVRALCVQLQGSGSLVDGSRVSSVLKKNFAQLETKHFVI